MTGQFCIINARSLRGGDTAEMQKMMRKALQFTAAAVLGSTLVMALILALTVVPAKAQASIPVGLSGVSATAATSGEGTRLRNAGEVAQQSAR